MAKWLIACLPLVWAVSPAQAQKIGAVENGVYHNNLTGIESKPKDSVSNAIATVWLKPHNADPANIEALMSGRLDSKARQCSAITSRATSTARRASSTPPLTGGPP